MAKVAVQAEVRVDRQGRVVIPLSLRRALSIEPDQPLMARVLKGRLVLEKRADVLARVKARFAKVPRKVDLAGELIAERREEARRE
jgi:bifunctional DNA-binding transcriptional regulator/antitoxin component of YhaV-PrlF toxin-antitoxin module